MAVPEFSCPTELMAALRLRLLNGQSSIIAVDGVDGSGKTSLATSLASILKASHIELDKYLLPGQSLYVDALKYHYLAATFSKSRQAGCTLIVEGLCVLKVLERLSTPHDLLIYVKGIGSGDSWSDESYCDGHSSIAEFSKHIHRMFAPLDVDHSLTSEEEEISLLLEVAFYHFEFRPLRQAHFVFRSKNATEPPTKLSI